MLSTSLRRKVVLVILLAVVAAPWPSAAEAPELTNPGDLFGRLWGFLKAVWSETGCHIDPDGLCVASNGEETRPADQVDEGCHIDPSGGCVDSNGEETRPVDQSNEGCHIDPDGRCSS